MIRQMSEWLVSNGFKDNPLHFNRFFPLYKLTNLPYTPLETLEKARAIAQKAGMKYVYIGNVPGTDYENTVCPSCKKTLVVRRGFTILENNIRNAACRFCGTAIPGNWS
jgi:pyruvate formate lyase activating enzyme